MRRSLQIIAFFMALIGFVYLIDILFGFKIATVLGIIISFSVIAVGLMIFLEDRQPSTTMAWLLILTLNPVLGLIFYSVFGRKYFRNWKGNRDEDIAQLQLTPLLHSDMVTNYPQLNETQIRLVQLGKRLAHSTVSFSTDTQILVNGYETFTTMIREMEKAKHHIHLEYYIVRDDRIGTKIKDILVSKATSGVEVRLLYDAVGSFQLSSSYIRELSEAGVRIVAFNPVKLPPLSSKMNHRNHRKIVVIDGQVGFVGGLNIGDEYLGESKKYGFWRDTHLLLRGEAVSSLQMIFLRDWMVSTDEQLKVSDYFCTYLDDTVNKGAVQIIASGPDQEWKTMKNLFFAMITTAKRSIWIATPYFIPDEDISTALKVAALSGIDVKIVFPKKPDKWLPYLASHSYFSKLLEAGVKVYEYGKGFMHSKILIVDGEIASIGTVNMDIRSFNLNFEVSAFIYGTESIKRLVSQFKQDLSDSTKLDQTRYKKGFFKRFMESAARLFSPLL